MQDWEEIWSEGLWMRDLFEATCADIYEKLKQSPVYGVFAGDHLRKIASKRAKDKLKEQLFTGAVIAAGRDRNRNGTIIRLPSQFWQTAEPNFTDNLAFTAEQSFVDIRVLVTSKAETTRSISGHFEPKISASTSDAWTELVDVIATSPHRHPEKGGARSYSDRREEVLLECLRRFPDFPEWSLSKQIEQAKLIAAKKYPDQGVEEKMGRSSFYASRKNLIQTGRWPSNNVQ